MHYSFSLAAAALLSTASALPGGNFGRAWKPESKYAWGTGSVSGSYPTASAGSGSVPAPIGTGSVPNATQPITIVAPTTSNTGSSTVKTWTIPTEVTSTITSFVPCSTPVMSNSETTFYSTWLTLTYLTTTYETVTTSCETIYPGSTPAPQASAEPKTTVAGEVTTLPAVTSVGIPSGTCPAPETVYQTVVSTVTVYGADTAPPATNTPIKPGVSLSWSASNPAGGAAKPTGYVKPSGYAKPSGWAKPSGH